MLRGSCTHKHNINEQLFFEQHKIALLRDSLIYRAWFSSWLNFYPHETADDDVIVVEKYANVIIYTST